MSDGFSDDKILSICLKIRNCLVWIQNNYLRNTSPKFARFAFARVSVQSDLIVFAKVKDVSQHVLLLLKKTISILKTDVKTIIHKF